MTANALITLVGTLKSKIALKIFLPNVVVLNHCAIIDSSKKSVKAACKITFSRMSWISQCLEANELVARDTFDLDKRKVVTVPVNTPAPSSVKDGATAQSDHATSYIDKNRHKFVCAKSSAQSTAEDAVKANPNPNKVVTDELEKLAAAYKATSDTWRAFGYQKAISALKNCGKVIRTRDEAASLPGVGAKMADKGFFSLYKDLSLVVFKISFYSDGDNQRGIVAESSRSLRQRKGPDARPFHEDLGSGSQDRRGVLDGGQADAG